MVVKHCCIAQGIRYDANKHEKCNATIINVQLQNYVQIVKLAFFQGNH